MSDDARQMARDQVQVQGNIFIRELLRENGYPPRRKQEDLLTTLYRAIDDGKITSDKLKDWLKRVEGWGRQSVYLWKVPKNLARESWWKHEPMGQRVQDAGIDVWDADSSNKFEDRFTLTSVRLRDKVLTFEWHKAWENLLRAESYDFEVDDWAAGEDDRLIFQAYKQSNRRAAVRIQVRPQIGLAAGFVQIPTSSSDHVEVFTRAKQTAWTVVPEEKFKPFDMSKVIERLDVKQLGSTDPELWTKSARLDVEGGYVELASTTKGEGYRTFDPLRETRDTLLGYSSTSKKAVIYFQAPGDIDTERPVRVDFYGYERRFWLRHAMTEEQVWKFIERIAEEVA